MNYCDNCGDVCDPDTMYVHTHVPFDVESARKGESAVLCEECNIAPLPLEQTTIN
jgi:hypothetical protein